MDNDDRSVATDECIKKATAAKRVSFEYIDVKDLLEGRSQASDESPKERQSSCSNLSVDIDKEQQIDKSETLVKLCWRCGRPKSATPSAEHNHNKPKEAELRVENEDNNIGDTLQVCLFFSFLPQLNFVQNSL